MTALYSDEPGATSEPLHKDVHLFNTGNGHGLLWVGGSRIFEIESWLAESLALCINLKDYARADSLIQGAGLAISAEPAGPPPESVTVKTFSLAIAQKCNLGCNYCYAEQGSFGGDAKSMPDSVAQEAIDKLFEGIPVGDELNLVFLGGEPLANRKGLRFATEYALAKAKENGVNINFSLTTNGTLITEEDTTFFERNYFSITVSLDGVGANHDQLRPFKSGRGSYEQAIDGARKLLSVPNRKLSVSARVTVTPKNLNLAETLKAFISLGFDSIQFSPMLSSPCGNLEMDKLSLKALLDGMIECGRFTEEQIMAGLPFQFSNLISTLKRIHQGIRDDYPCGAGGSYLGVSSEGGLYACHRFVGDESYSMGSVTTGVDSERQARWLAGRNVNHQLPCNTCWARNFCGGGCHYEAIHAGRPACDYIRGWLHYCLGAYVRLSRAHPRFFDQI